VSAGLFLVGQTFGDTNYFNGTDWVRSANIYNDNTNVGIGTSIPTTKLDVNGQIRMRGGSPGAGKYLIGDATGIASWTGFVIANSLNIPGSILGSTLYYDGSNWVPSTNIYNAGGNVGIGISTPGSKLEVAWQIKITGGSPWVGKTLISDAVGLASWWIPALANTVYATWVIAMASSGGYVTKFMPSGSGITNSLFFESGANIGLGNTNPGAKLDITWQIRITGGTPWVGRVLTSDATGLASWIAPGAVLCPGTGINNTCYGIGSLFSNTTGFENTANGVNSLYLNTLGYQNSAFGANSLQSNTIWNYNTALGNLAGWTITTGSSNIAIGYNAQVPSATLSNQLSIGNWIYGTNGDIGIGTSTPITKLDIAWQIRIQGGSPWVGKVLLSDAAGIATWGTPPLAGTVYATGIIALSASGNYITKFWPSGSGITSSIMFESGWNIGVNTTDPSASFDINGRIRIRGGTPYSGWLLTSDANGLASWTTPTRICTPGGSLTLGNVCYGENALQLNTTWYNNTAIGDSALRNNTIWGINFAAGQWALRNNINGVSNVGIGYESLNSNISGSNNIGIWYAALWSNMNTTNNTAIWFFALRNLTVGWVNTVIGNASMQSLINGNYNNVLGQSLTLMNTGSYNNVLWTTVWDNLRTGNQNTLIGNATLYSATWAESNIMIWNGAWYSFPYSVNNVMIWNSAWFYQTSGWENTYIWDLVGFRILGGNNNTFLWSRAAWNSNNTGSLNLIVWSYAGDVFQWQRNTFLWTEAWRSAIGSSNVLIGAAAWWQWSPVWSSNIYIGDYAGILHASWSTNSIFINANTNSNLWPNQLNIGNWIYGNGGNIGIGVSNTWSAKLEIAWQVKITGGVPWVGKVLLSDATGLATWSSSFSGSTSASGITGGAVNILPKFGSGGNGLVSSQIFDNGTNIGVGISTGLDTKFTIDSGINDDSGLKFARLTPNSPLTSNGVVALGVDGSGKVLPISPISNIAVYNGVDRVTVLTPNPDLNTFNITYDFNRYFAIPGKQSFVVSSGNSASYNGPYFKENGANGVCSRTDPYASAVGAGNNPYDCEIADPVTGISASPYNSFTMSAKGDVFGYQLALGARGDAPLFARSGRFNGSQTGWLFTNDAPYQTPVPWQRVLSLPANHPEYLYINTGLNSQLQAVAGGGNVGIGTSTPQSRFEVWTGSTSNTLLHFRGTNNLGFGLNASRWQSSGTANSAFGHDALRTATTGYSNTALGYSALYSNQTGFFNTAWWTQSLYTNSDGTWNVALGSQSLYANVWGDYNLALGGQSLYFNSTGDANIALGYQALRGVSGDSVLNNVAIGYQSLYSNTADSLVGVGYKSLYANTSGVQNTAIGYQSLDSITTTSNNTAIGYNALATATSGDNTAIGNNAGSNLTTGSSNIAIGSNIQLVSNTASNQLNIGNWIYGNGGNIGINVAAPDRKLNVSEWTSTNKIVKLQRGIQWADTNMVTTYGTPYLQIGGMEYRGNSLQTIGFGYENSTSSFAPAEIGFLTTNTAWQTSGDIVFANRNGTTNIAPTEVARITSAGNMGIGTNAPWARLEVNGQVKITWGVPWAGKILMSDATGLASWQTPTGAAAIPWAIAGNAGTDPTSNFIGTLDNFGLAFRTNNVENMRLLTSGNLGIGTNVPASRLSISGWWLSVGYPTIAAPTNGTIIAGNVGIGTNSPAESLTVNGTIENPLDNSAIVSGNDRSFGFIKKSGFTSVLATNNSNPIIFSKLSTAMITSGNVAWGTLIELMRIQNNGDVGIGVAAPGAKLDINWQVRIQGGVPGIGKILVSDATGLASWQTAATGAAGWWLIGNAGTVATTNFLGTTDNVDLVFRTNATEKVRVQAGGNVGIGIAAPGVKLDVAWLIRSTNNNSAYFQWGDDAQLWDVNQPNTVGIVGMSDATKWAIQLGNNTATYIAGSAGNIGIGTTTPGAKLEVAGQVKITWGTPWAGRVLTSDAAGLATWSPVTATLTWGTNNYIARWNSTSTLGIGTLFDNGTNVWVGITSPNAKLDVNGNLAVRWDAWGSIYTWNGSDANWRMGTSNAPWYARLVTTGYNQFQTFSATAGNGFSVGDVTTGLSAFEVASSSNAYKSYFRWNVGIGVDPTQSLDVTGQVRIRGGSPGVGKYLVSDATGVGTWTTPASAGTGSYIYRMASQQSSTSTTLINVTQLTSVPLPIWPYQFEMIGKFQSAATTTGIGLTLAQTSGASTAFIGSMSAQLTPSTTYDQSFMSAGTAAISPSVPAAGSDYAVLLKGTFEVTSTGTVAVQLASEVNGSQVILGIGSALIIRSLDPSLAGWGI
jgi:hypothetical protein